MSEQSTMRGIWADYGEVRQRVRKMSYPTTGLRHLLEQPNEDSRPSDHRSYWAFSAASCECRRLLSTN